MAKKSYKKQITKLASIIGRLTRKFSPDQIQHELANAYELNSIASTTESEVEFWLKCGRASFNLSSGMNKWAHEMVDDLKDELEEEEEDANPDAND